MLLETRTISFRRKNCVLIRECETGNGPYFFCHLVEWVFFLPTLSPARPIYDAAQFVELMTEFDVAMDPLHLRRLFAS